MISRKRHRYDQSVCPGKGGLGKASMLGSQLELQRGTFPVGEGKEFQVRGGRSSRRVMEMRRSEEE